MKNKIKILLGISSLLLILSVTSIIICSIVFVNSLKLRKEYIETECLLQNVVRVELCEYSGSCDSQNEELYWYRKWGSSYFIDLINKYPSISSSSTISSTLTSTTTNNGTSTSTSGKGTSTDGGASTSGSGDGDNTTGENDDDGGYAETTGHYDDDGGFSASTTTDGGTDAVITNNGGTMSGEGGIAGGEIAGGLLRYYKRDSTSGASDLTNIREIKRIKKNNNNNLQLQQKNQLNNSSSNSNTCNSDCFQGVFYLSFNTSNNQINSTMDGLYSNDLSWVQSYIDGFSTDKNYSCYYSSSDPKEVVMFIIPRFNNQIMIGLIVSAVSFIVFAILLVIIVKKSRKSHHQEYFKVTINYEK